MLLNFPLSPCTFLCTVVFYKLQLKNSLFSFDIDLILLDSALTHMNKKINFSTFSLEIIFRPLFSTKAYGAEKTSEANNLTKDTRSLLRIPTGWRQTSWLFTNVAEDLNSDYNET